MTLMKGFVTKFRLQKVHHDLGEGPFTKIRLQKVHHKLDEGPFYQDPVAKSPS